ncbi:MAG: hypothetical protein IT545_00295 [Rhodobacteraceae bacterium]|nr:hypothetical protein [Paracoccaceae bacterium]
MRMPLLAALAALSLVGACGTMRESRLNPVNWFRASEARAPTLAPEEGYGPTFVDNRPFVEQVTLLEIEAIPGGAILRAAGLPPTQGWWDAELVTLEDAGGAPAEAGVLAFRFLLAAPRSPQPASTPVSREVTVATFLSDIRLRDVRQIIVRGRLNERVIRR